MPYQREFASKASHFDIIKNPDITQFLENCAFLIQPSAQEGQIISAQFAVPPSVSGITLPEKVIAIDGSYYEASINEHLPSTKVGYVKIGALLIDMAKFNTLRPGDGRLVDPFKVGELQKDNSALTFCLPSANICLKGKKSVRDSFRAAVDEQLYSIKTRFIEKDARTSLRTTLFHLAARRRDALSPHDTTRLTLHRCPSCAEGPFEVEDVPEQQQCKKCGNDIYPADCLRLWEEVVDHQSNSAALTRFMLVIEHMMTFHYIRCLREISLSSLAVTAFFIDGPLALFGPAAWLHSAIMRYITEVNEQLANRNLPKLLILGLQKTGQVVDHLTLIERFIEPNKIFAIEDEYRYKYILPGRDPSGNGFGYETYYGQDFLYKTASGRKFVFALPYPFAEKKGPDTPLRRGKTELGRYPELARTLALINNFEIDLYQDAVVPIALAHRYTAISLVPGGKVLDVLTRQVLQNKKGEERHRV